jgi:hypothetical protein
MKNPKQKRRRATSLRKVASVLVPQGKDRLFVADLTEMDE